MIKDLVYIITETLEDRDVINLSLISKYYNRILDENYWKKRLEIWVKTSKMQK